jgi:hypothetical protein
MRAFFLSMFLSLGFLALSFSAMRRRRLREQAALLWLGVSVVMVFLSATLPLHLLNRLAQLLGIAYPPDLLLLLAVLFLFVLVFQMSLSLDRLSAKQTTIVQEVGLAAAAPPRFGGEAATRRAGRPEVASDAVDPVTPDPEP